MANHPHLGGGGAIAQPADEDDLQVELPAKPTHQRLSRKDEASDEEKAESDSSDSDP